MTYVCLHVRNNITTLKRHVIQIAKVNYFDNFPYVLPCYIGICICMYTCAKINTNNNYISNRGSDYYG